MLRLLSDENFNGDAVRGLLLRGPDMELVRVQDELPWPIHSFKLRPLPDA